MKDFHERPNAPDKSGLTQCMKDGVTINRHNTHSSQQQQTNQRMGGVA